MSLLIRYIRNDLEGVYTAELLRGSLSMLLAVILEQCSSPGPANAYILIMGLYGLRSLHGNTLLRRLGNILVSLVLLTGTLALALCFGQEKLWLPQLLFAVFLSSGTVWALRKRPEISGTVMFMSVFAVVNFGMGLIDHEILLPDLLRASLLGGLAVFLAVLLIPFLKIHWCAVINRCFYHDLREYARVMTDLRDLNTFSEIRDSVKNRLLMLQSSLFNITSYVNDPVRKARYLRLLNALLLITYWPHGPDAPEEHRKRIVSIRRGLFERLQRILSARNPETLTALLQDLENFKCEIRGLPRDPFCGGEMTGEAALAIREITALMRERLPHD
ncbi:hypothetical protein [Succinimonas sp.]|uniref:hypothetical protein n=1 Tax=Succinimonas sp. TaxID=1936151 RepID=UPI00386C0869